MDDCRPLEWTGDHWELHYPPHSGYDLKPVMLVSCERFLEFHWCVAGYAVAEVDPRHHTLVIRDLFTGERRPSRDELDWFRMGFATQRSGSKRPCIRG